MVVYDKIHYTKNIIDRVNIKNAQILDFGCGLSTFSKKDLDKISNIIYYDKNIELKPLYKNELFFSQINKIKKFKFDLIIISSVIQYLNKNELSKTLLLLKTLLNDKGCILILDIPIYNRYFEFIFWFFFDFNRFLKAIKLISNNLYLKEKYYKHNLYDFKKFKVKILKNKRFDSRIHLEIS